MKKTLHEKLCTAIAIPMDVWEKVDKAEAVCDEFAVAFSLFCAENTFSYSDGNWRMKELKPNFKTTQELLIMFKKQIQNDEE